MSSQRIYRATNIDTGEVITGYAEELAERFNVTKKSLYGYADRGVRANGVWDIDVPENQRELLLEKTGDNDFCYRWDSFTEPIREYIRRRNDAKK